MEKFLVTIEFRYNDVLRHKKGWTQKTKKVTIGVYDNFDDACKEGNKLMENLESKFDLHIFPNGKGTAKRERFSRNDGCFGSKKNLITNLAYLKTPFQFFANITTLKYDVIDNVIEEVTDSVKSYKEFTKINI
tara:strand:+ start:526 stop:924 length:399 start_codon:yes stop_codon:yes gene_type:complete